MNDEIDTILTRYNRPVPRYTSYPPATRFIGSDDVPSLYAAWLNGVEGDISLYLHIPFCRKLCYYCGCHMRVVNHYDPIRRYLKTLEQEFELVRRSLGAKAGRVTQIHFGGGSPTSVKGDDFLALMDSLRRNFSVADTAEISVEADPRNMDEERIKAYAKAGVTRISFGVQSFDTKVLDAINRPQPFDVTARAVELCRAQGLNNINFDLMYGLPYQTPQSIANTIQQALTLAPSRIAFFGYAHVPWMKKHMALIDESTLPNVHERYDSYHAGKELLETSGYVSLGIDHFVQKSDSMYLAYETHQLRRNFQGYTVDPAPNLIGLGVSSIGQFSQGYVQNNPDFQGYSDAVEKGDLPVTKYMLYQGQDMIHRAVIEELMCYMHIDLSDVSAQYGLEEGYFDVCKERLSPLISDGLVVVDGSCILIPEDKKIFARLVCSAFDEYLPASDSGVPRRHAQAI